MFKIKQLAFLLLVVLVAIPGNLLVLANGTDDGASSRPPGKFGDWEVVGPAGGDVRVVAIDPKDKNRLYISTIEGQVYTSADGGKSWRLLVNLDRSGLILDQLFVDSQDSKTIYTSGHRNTSPGGFFRSNDGGATWIESKELKNEAIHSMTQSSFDPKILTVGTLKGVWISKNSGVSWQKIESPTMPHDIDSMAIDPRNTSTIYAGTWWRPYKSTDSGKSWRLIKDGMIDDSDVFAVDIDPRNADHIISSACSGIYESFNGGEKWAKIQGIPSQSRRTRDILQHPSVAGTIYAATTEGFWMSSNGGKAWSLTTSRDLEVNSIAVHPDAPNRVFIGTNNYGVMVSNDGGRNFTQTNENFSSRFTYSITPDNKQPNRLYAATLNTATGGGFMFISNDGGRTWQQARNWDPIHIVPFAIMQDETNPNLIYAGTNAGIYKSIDRGVNWSQMVAPKPVVHTPVRRAGSGAAARKAVVAAPSASGPKLLPAIMEKVKVLTHTADGKNGIIAGTDKGLYRSYDLTKGWEKLPITGGLDDNIFTVHISPLRPETIWAGTANSGVIVSHDDGKTWQKAGGAADNVPVSCITSDPKRPDYIYVGTIQTFYLSRDGGKTWTRRGGNLPIGNYTSILLNPANSDEIIVASAFSSDGGIYQTTDGGNRWKRIDSKDMNLASRQVWALVMDPFEPNRLFAGTHSGGVYRIERSAAVAEKPAGDRPRVSPDGN